MEIRVYDGNAFDANSGYVSLLEDNEDTAIELVRLLTRYGLQVLIWRRG